LDLAIFSPEELQEEQQEKQLLAQVQAVIEELESQKAREHQQRRQRQEQERRQLEAQAQQQAERQREEHSVAYERTFVSTKDDLFAYLDQILAGQSISVIEEAIKAKPLPAVKARAIGIIEYEDGMRYEGELDANDDWCGTGRVYFAEGDFFEGQVERSCMHGVGTLVFANGDKVRRASLSKQASKQAEANCAVSGVVRWRVRRQSSTRAWPVRISQRRYV